MGILNKIKTIKRKWIYIISAILIIVVAGGVTAGVIFHEKFDGRHEGNKDKQSCYQAYYNLLYLQNTDNLKLSPDEAKALLPLVQKLSSVTDETAQASLVKSIYSQLTPEQYFALLNGNQNGMVGRDHGMKGHRGESFGGWNREEEKGETGTLTDATKNVVINMLKNLSK